MLLQPGLQAMLKTRKELASVSVTTTLVPSAIPLTKAQSPAATVTVCAAALPTVTLKLKFVPALIPLPATLQSFRLPRFDSFVNRTSVVASVETVAVTLPPVRSTVVHAAAGLQVIALTFALRTGASTMATLAVPAPGPPTRPSLKPVSTAVSELSCAVERGVVSWIALPLTVISIPLFACAIAASTLGGATTPLSTLRSAASSC